MPSEIKSIQSNNEDLYLWLRACLDSKSYPWEDGKKQIAILSTIEYKQFKNSNTLEVLKDINESLSDSLTLCVNCDEYHWDGHQKQAAQWAINERKANLTDEQEKLMLDWYYAATDNNFIKIFTVYDNLNCCVSLKDGTTINCIAAAMDELQNWSILTKDNRTVQYLATEVL
jgi:hypothetical protein